LLQQDAKCPEDDKELIARANKATYLDLVSGTDSVDSANIEGL